MQAVWWIIGLIGVLLLAWRVGGAANIDDNPGQAIYDYFCYQCHGYSGDGKTLASTYLTPPPRNFTISDPATLTRTQMINAVTHGKPGTAMSSFSRVLSAEQIGQVVDFIRQTFQARPVQQRYYHTEANGWPDHERYAAAFPFARGDIPLDISWDTLTDAQREGKRLYLDACVSCHDHASANVDQPVWSPRAVSYPRQYYVYHETDHDDEHHEDASYPELAFELHEYSPEVPDLSLQERHGERIYQANCAFCHAEDGTGLNWIGSFLEPHPPDLNRRLVDMDEDDLTRIIVNGIKGTSMPAWRGILEEAELAAVIAYMQRVFTETVAVDDLLPVAENKAAPKLEWRRLEN